MKEQDAEVDMKSATDSAARILMWTELFRGGCQWGGERGESGMEGQGGEHPLTSSATHRTGHDPKLPLSGACHYQLPL